MSNVLVDTQALIWFAKGSAKLSRAANLAIDDRTFIQFVSVASIWEMAIKFPLGKLKLKSQTLPQFVKDLTSWQFQILSVSVDDAIRVADLPQIKHKDPFDRLIAVQALQMRLPLVFVRYRVRRLRHPTHLVSAKK